MSETGNIERNLESPVTVLANDARHRHMIMVAYMWQYNNLKCNMPMQYVQWHCISI